MHLQVAIDFSVCTGYQGNIAYIIQQTLSLDMTIGLNESLRAYKGYLYLLHCQEM